MLQKLITFERELFDRGIKYIAGVDEVGRGPLAGPFVAGAVILDLEKLFSLLRNNDVSGREIPNQYNEINDSKQLTAKKRETLNKFIINETISYSIYEISAKELDEIGISAATQKAFYTCVQTLKIKPDHVFTDRFEIKQLTQETQTNITGGDHRSISVAAASVIAKVYRDNIMDKFHSVYPEYDFIHNKGYGTKKHLEALTTCGICPIHRKSFSPIKEWYEKNN
jgi:ribonuclease HII